MTRMLTCKQCSADIIAHIFVHVIDGGTMANREKWDVLSFNRWYTIAIPNAVSLSSGDGNSLFLPAVVNTG